MSLPRTSLDKNDFKDSWYQAEVGRSSSTVAIITQSKSPSIDATAQLLYIILLFQDSWNQGNIYDSYGLQLLPLIFK